MAVFASTAALVAKQAGLCVVQGKVLFIFFKVCFHPRLVCVCLHPCLSFLPHGGKHELFSTPSPLHFPLLSHCFLF